MFCILPFYAIGGEYILRKIRKFFQYDTIGMLFVFPAFLYMLVFVGYPIVRNIILSLQDVTMANLVHGMKKFVGFQNYIELFKDSVFRTSLINTLVFTVRCLVMQFIIGFALAIFFNKRFAISKPLRGILLVPWMIPITVTALIFKLLFATDIGVLNYILKSLHLVSENIEWLTTPQTAMFALICANVWIGIPFNMILISTGLTTIPKDLYESASIDGATGLQAFFKITLPLLRPTIESVLILGFIYTFKAFDLMFIMTKGGPLNSTDVLGTYAYTLSFTKYEFSMGAAAAMILFCCLFVIGLFYLKLISKEDE